MDEDAVIPMFIVILLMCTAIGFFAHGCGNDVGEQTIKKEAVLLGFAYYTNDAKGESIWNWKNNPANTNSTLSVTNIVNEPTIKLEKE